MKKMTKLFSLALVLVTLLPAQTTQASTDNERNIAQQAEAAESSYSALSDHLRPRKLPRHISNLQGELALTQEQRPIFRALVKATQTYMVEQRQKVKKLEASVFNQIIHQGKTSAELMQQLDEIQQLKRDIAEREMMMFNELKALLTTEQYATALRNAGWNLETQTMSAP